MGSVHLFTKYICMRKQSGFRICQESLLLICWLVKEITNKVAASFNLANVKSLASGSRHYRNPAIIWTLLSNSDECMISGHVDWFFLFFFFSFFLGGRFRMLWEKSKNKKLSLKFSISHKKSKQKLKYFDRYS